MNISEGRIALGRSLTLPEPWCSADVMVVLPTYQEAANLPAVVGALFDLPLPGLRILVADDNSPDGTGQVAEELADRYGRSRLEVMHRPVKEGLGRAYTAGMSKAIEAGAEFVVQMDSDLSHGPEYLPQMLGTLLSTGADVVIGSRYVAGGSVGAEWPRHRKALSAFANAYVRLLLRLAVRDATAGYKLWRAAALNTIDLQTVRSGGYSFQVEMNYRSVRRGLKIIELPIHFSQPGRRQVQDEPENPARVSLHALQPQALHDVGPGRLPGNKSRCATDRIRLIFCKQLFEVVCVLGFPFPVSQFNSSSCRSQAMSKGGLTSMVEALDRVRPFSISDEHPPGMISGARGSLDILIVTSEAPPIVSGISTCIGRLEKGLRDSGHRVTVISSVQIPRITVGEWRFSSFAAYWRRLARELQDFDVVNVHGPIPTMSDFFLREVTRLPAYMRPPVVYTYHSPIDIKGASRLSALYNRYHRSLALRADRIVASGQHYASVHRTRFGPPVRSIPWGVDLPASGPAPLPAGRRPRPASCACCSWARCASTKGCRLCWPRRRGRTGWN